MIGCGPVCGRVCFHLHRTAASGSPASQEAWLLATTRSHMCQEILPSLNSQPSMDCSRLCVQPGHFVVGMTVWYLERTAETALTWGTAQLPTHHAMPSQWVPIPWAWRPLKNTAGSHTREYLCDTRLETTRSLANTTMTPRERQERFRQANTWKKRAASKLPPWARVW